MLTTRIVVQQSCECEEEDVLPHEKAWPSLVRAKVWFCPHATFVTVNCDKACICLGCG